VADAGDVMGFPAERSGTAPDFGGIEDVRLRLAASLFRLGPSGRERAAQALLQAGWAELTVLIESPPQGPSFADDAPVEAVTSAVYRFLVPMAPTPRADAGAER
jgi:hypothetical protein